MTFCIRLVARYVALYSDQEEIDRNNLGVGYDFFGENIFYCINTDSIGLFDGNIAYTYNVFKSRTAIDKRLFSFSFWRKFFT